MQLKTFVWLFVSLLLAVPASAADGAGELIRIPSARAAATIPVFVHTTKGARATVVLLSGGGGGIGNVKDGVWPDSKNFVVRTAPQFANNGVNVVVVGRVSDMKDLDYSDRISTKHVDDLRRVLQMVKKTVSGPIWMVGTSRGTVSATAAGIALRDEKLIDGLVLTSSVTNFKKTGAIPSQNLDLLTVPVLVMHHERDACKICNPNEVPAILKGLTNAPIKKLVMVNGGGNPIGDPCEALHYHGFIGMEKEAVSIITNWIKKPTG